MAGSNNRGGEDVKNIERTHVFSSTLYFPQPSTFPSTIVDIILIYNPGFPGSHESANSNFSNPHFHMATSATLIIAIMVVSMILLIASIILTFMSNTFAVLAAFAGLAGIGLTAVHATSTPLIFWGIATVIVLILQYLLPKNISTSRRGVGYIAGAALAGTFVGLAISHEWMIIGAVAGAILGGIAYSRTPAGSVMEFPSSKFLNYLCAKGLPAVVTMSIVGTALLWLIAAFSSNPTVPSPLN